MSLRLPELWLKSGSRLALSKRILMFLNQDILDGLGFRATPPPPRLIFMLIPLGHFSSTRTEGDFVIAPSSRHPGGVNAVMVDGSVRFVQDSIDQQVWWTLGARDDGRAGI